MKKGKFEGIYLFSDIDGTLSSVHDEIPQNNRDAIKYFVDNGGTFAVATGRYLGDLDLLEGLDVNGISILNNGACLYDFQQRQIIKTLPLPQDAVMPILNYCTKHQELGVLIVNDRGYITTIIDSVQRPIFHERYCVENIQNLQFPFYKILIVANEDIYETLLAIRELSVEGVDAVQTGRNSIEIVPKGMSKGKAFLELCKKLHIDKEHSFFVGDSFNDISIMKEVGCSAAMEEADDYVKGNADFVLCSLEEGSIHKMIEMIENQQL